MPGGGKPRPWCTGETSTPFWFATARCVSLGGSTAAGWIIAATPGGLLFDRRFGAVAPFRPRTRISPHAGISEAFQNNINIKYAPNGDASGNRRSLPCPALLPVATRPALILAPVSGAGCASDR